MGSETVEIPRVEGADPLRRNAVWLFFQVILRVVFAVWLRYRARGLERLPASGGGLLLANHQSFLDPLLVGLPLHRTISYLARDSLFRVPVIGWILRKTYVVPIKREGGSTAVIRESLRRMEQGFFVGIFPEGTRSADGSVGTFKPGFAALVRRTNLPVFPVGIAGANRAMGRGSWFVWPRRVCVVYGEPFPAEEIARLSERGKEEELAAAVRGRIVECHEEAERWLQGRTDNAKSGAED